MKILIFPLMSLISAQASAAPFKCYMKATQAVMYKGEQAEAYKCKQSKNQKVVVCEVASLTDIWQVILNHDCSRVYLTEIMEKL